MTFRMLVSNNKAGLLIGKGGCVISHLRQTLPGAKMSVLDAGAPLYLECSLCNRLECPPLLAEYPVPVVPCTRSTLYPRTASVYRLAT